MAFGVIQVTPVRSRSRVAPGSAPPLPNGGERLSILLVADSLTRAEDFLCGVYFNLVSAASGSGLSVYTRQFETITRLSELKQQLEQAALAPAGREVARDAGEYPPLRQAVLTLGLAGRASPFLDLAFTCAAPGAAGEGGGEAVIALVDAHAGPNAARAVGELARRAAGGGSVIWVITGFEDAMLLSDDAPAPPPQDDLRLSLRAGLELSPGEEDMVTYAQLYGGLELVRADGEGGSVMRSHPDCLDYVPAACHLGVLTAVGLRARQCPAGTPLSQLWPLIWKRFQTWSTGRAGWLENGREDGQHET